MKVKAIYRPGQKGTRKLVAEYGNKLVCVRYRYDYQKLKKYKTIELIIDEQAWTPPEPHPDEEKPRMMDVVLNRQVGVRIGINERDLQQKIRMIGGVWSRQDRVWYASEENIRRIGLGERIVE